jgi:hypothetical protein
MKKLLLVLFLFIVFFQLINAQELSGYNGSIDPFIDEKNIYSNMSGYIFPKNEYEFTTSRDHEKTRIEIPESSLQETYYQDNEQYVEQGNYSITYKQELPYVNFVSNSEFTYKSQLGALWNERWLYLYDNNQLLFQPDDGLRFGGCVPEVISVRTSSYLTEGTVKYDGQNFIPLSQKELKPWVANKGANGIGEWIELIIHKEEWQFAVSSFFISNGYVNFNRPELYGNNSHVKKIQVICTEAGIDATYELEDTPNLQTIRLPKEINTETITVQFQILEVYPGSRWGDICINMIVPMGDLP